MNTTRSNRPLQAAVLLFVGALLLAGCGNDANSSDKSGRSTVEVSVGPDNGASALPVAERRFFSETSPWNTRIDDNNIDSSSNEMIDQSTLRVGVVERAGSTTLRLERRRITEGLFINTEGWTTPVVAGGVPTDVVCRQIQCGDGDHTVVLNIPEDVDPDPRYDGWFTIFDTNNSVAYDLWRARREQDGSISYHFMRMWDLDGPGYSSPQVGSARGSGLPLFAGLIRPGELEAGEINHALAISVPGPAAGYFVQPASATDGNGTKTSLPEGARIRLKSDVILPAPRDPITGKRIKLNKQQQRMADAIVAALRTYGAIVVDRALVPTLYAQRGATAGLLQGNELRGLRMEDFEVVNIGERYSYPPRDTTDATGLIVGGTSTDKGVQ